MINHWLPLNATWTHVLVPSQSRLKKTLVVKNLSIPTYNDQSLFWPWFNKLYHNTDGCQYHRENESTSYHQPSQPPGSGCCSATLSRCSLGWRRCTWMRKPARYSVFYFSNYELVGQFCSSDIFMYIFIHVISP